MSRDDVARFKARLMRLQQRQTLTRLRPLPLARDLARARSVRARRDAFSRCICFGPLRFAFYLSRHVVPARACRHARRALAAGVRGAGPIFMKFGQMLSTRRDLLPRDIADELEKRRTACRRSAAWTQACHRAGWHGIPDGKRSPRLDLTLAAATIAQVHAATLKNGKEVVVKVVRPVRFDPDRVRSRSDAAPLADLANRYWSQAGAIAPG